MGEIGVSLVKWAVKIGPVLGAITAYIIIINIAIAGMFAGFNAGAFTDVFAMVSMWLPFDLNVIMLWIVSTSVAYMSYRMAWVGVSWINRLMS